MRRPAALATAVASVLVLTGLSAASFAQAPPAETGVTSPRAPSAPTPLKAQARRTWAAAPLAFEANRGQTDARVRYLAKGDGFTVYLTRRGPVFDLAATARSTRRGEQGADGVAVALRPVGARPADRIVGTRRTGATSSYFRGSDPSQWQRGVATYGRVRYQGIYRGIDMVVRGERAAAEYDFVVAPGADPTRIGYRLRGADGLQLRNGDLVASTAVGEFVHHAPIAYQWIDGHRQRVDARFRLRHGVVSFDLGAYDPRRPLVIDPETEVEYGTFLGGDEIDGANAVALDDGDLYLTGYTRSPDFPTTFGAYDRSRSNQSDVFVVRLSPDESGTDQLVYSTFLGGTGPSTYDDEGLDIAVADGAVYVTGLTFSAGFPTTAGALDTSLGGDRDGFLAVISPDGSGAADLAYSTFVGGSGEDGSAALAVADGDVYLTGSTGSADFPLTAGAYDTTAGYGAFVTRISPDGEGAADVVYSSYVEASSGNDIALADGHVFLTGLAVAAFPTTAGAYDRSFNGGYDAFVAELSLDGAGSDDLVYSTFVGGKDDDEGLAIAVDGGDAYVTGATRSADWPTTPGAHDRSYGRDGDTLIARISPDGAGASDLVYSTYLDVLEWNTGYDVAVHDGDVYVAGTAEIYDKYGGGDDAFLARLSPDGAGAGDLAYLGLLGDDDDDDASGLALDGDRAWVAGYTASYYFPTTDGAYDTTANDLSGDAFLALIDPVDNTVWPDALIRRAGRPDVGDDNYGQVPPQSASARARRKQERVFWVTAQNDDNATDSFTIAGGGASAEKWVVRYFHDGVDITAQVAAGGYTTPVLAPGEEDVVKVTIKPRRTARKGSTKRVEVEVTSTTDTHRSDFVLALVTVKRH